MEGLNWEAELKSVPPGAVRHALGMESPAGFKMALVLDEQAPENNGVYFVPAIELLPPQERERAKRSQKRAAVHGRSWCPPVQKQPGKVPHSELPTAKDIAKMFGPGDWLTTGHWLATLPQTAQALSDTPCARWTGPGGDCTTCGIAAYDHPGAPTPAQRGCQTFVCSGPGIDFGKAKRCDFCCLPKRDHKPQSEWEILFPQALALACNLACNRARLFLADLTDLGLAEERQAGELRHRLRQPSLSVLREAVLFLGGVHPARPGQAALVTDLLRLLRPESCEAQTPACAPGRGLTLEQLKDLISMR